MISESARRLSLIMAIFGIVLGLILGGCANNRRSEFIALADRARARAMPSGGRVLSESPIDERRSSLAISWEVELSSPWPIYCDFVERSVAPEYDKVQKRDGVVVLSKTLPGEMQWLKIESIADTPVPRARLSFTVNSD